MNPDHTHHYVPQRSGTNGFGEPIYVLMCECGQKHTPQTTPPSETKAERVCQCPHPKPSGKGECQKCGKFACPYANRNESTCPPWRCDCFIDQFPVTPFDLHPEAFKVVTSDERTRDDQHE